VRSAAESVAYHLSGWYQRLRGNRPADLVTDPVCHMRVDPASAAATRRHDDTEYAFCSARCARKFESDPGRYATAVSSPRDQR
jgi:P-type Cu+ transporter